MIIFESATIFCEATLEYYVDGYFTIDILMEIEDFKGRRAFCLSHENLIKLISQSKEILDSLEGSTTLEDYDSESQISFHLNRTQTDISGVFCNPSGDLSLNFAFATDQTFISNFVSFLNGISRIA